MMAIATERLEESLGDLAGAMDFVLTDAALGPVRRFRPDIEGLRAVAILGVVLYHAHVGVVRGGFTGVDVFFVVSGYLITGLLWDELEGSGRIRFAAFYGRRARRLLARDLVARPARQAPLPAARLPVPRPGPQRPPRFDGS